MHKGGRILTIVAVALLFGSGLALYFFTPRPETPAPQSTSVKTVVAPKIVDTAEIFAIVNKNRTTHGLAPLIGSPLLDKSAQLKCADMVNQDYWAHNAPDGTEPWVFFSRVGYSYSMAGENLAYGFSASSDLVTGWMDSPGHRKNILTPEFNEVGYAKCAWLPNSTHYGTLVVQHFAKKY